ncbi:hypothetical protein AB0478_17880 [Streptomyces sp. NPDC051917]|uniref:hypothetical protein n=1 Tax=Streptomyces sp. NPDC051917 TaxID=3154754 RepID=UPI00344F8C75
MDLHIRRSTALAAVTAGPVVLHPAGAAARGLAPDATADLSGFAGSPWLLPGTDTACHEMTQGACGTAGFTLRSVDTPSDFAGLCALAARRADAVALVPRLAPPDPGVPGLSGHSLRVRYGAACTPSTGPGPAGTRAPAMSSAAWRTSPRSGDRR